MKHLGKDEMTAILTVAKACDTRDWLMMLVTYLHALRASECVGRSSTMRPLKGKMVEFWPIRGRDVRDGQLLMKRLKGSAKTDQPLVSSADPLWDEKTALEALAATNKGILFPITRQQYWNIWQKYGAMAGIKKTLSHPHIAKHSVITHAVEAGVPVNKIKKFAGHESLSSTGAYMDADDNTAMAAVVAGITKGAGA